MKHTHLSAQLPLLTSVLATGAVFSLMSISLSQNIVTQIIPEVPKVPVVLNQQELATNLETYHFNFPSIPENTSLKMDLYTKKIIKIPQSSKNDNIQHIGTTQINNQQAQISVDPAQLENSQLVIKVESYLSKIVDNVPNQTIDTLIPE